MGIFGKPSHIPSQRKGLIGFLQDTIQVSGLQDKSKAESKPAAQSPGSGSGVSARNQKKLDLVDHYDNEAGKALARGDHKGWEANSKRAQETDDSIK